MPHVLVKLYAGRTDQQKAKLAEAITKTVMAALKLGRAINFGRRRRCRAGAVDGKGLQAGYFEQSEALQETGVRSALSGND